MGGTLLAFGAEGSGIDYVYDTATRQGRSTRLPHPYTGQDYQSWQSTVIYGAAIRVSDRIVATAGPKDGAARPHLLTSPPDVQSRPLGDLSEPADSLANASSGDLEDYFPSTDGRDVWIVTRRPSGGTSVVERDPDTGTALTAPVALPAGARPIAAVRGGLLTETDHAHSSTLSVRSAHTGRTLRTITRNGSADWPVVSATGDLVAWQAPGRCGFCTLHLTKLRTGQTRPVRWRSRQRFVCDSGALSPNGRWLAVSYGCARPHMFGKSPVILVNTRSARVRIVPGSAQFDGGAVDWTPNSRWMLWQKGFHQGYTMCAYRPGQRRSHQFRVPSPRGGAGGFLQSFPAAAKPAERGRYDAP